MRTAAAHLERGAVVKLEDDDSGGVRRQRGRTSRTYDSDDDSSAWERAVLHLTADGDSAGGARGR